jgi:hypothetical protein
VTISASPNQAKLLLLSGGGCLFRPQILLTVTVYTRNVRTASKFIIL